MKIERILFDPGLIKYVPSGLEGDVKKLAEAFGERKFVSYSRLNDLLNKYNYQKEVEGLEEALDGLDNRDEIITKQGSFKRERTSEFEFLIVFPIKTKKEKRVAKDYNLQELEARYKERHESFDPDSVLDEGDLAYIFQASNDVKLKEYLRKNEIEQKKSIRRIQIPTSVLEGQLASLTSYSMVEICLERLSRVGSEIKEEELLRNLREYIRKNTKSKLPRKRIRKDPLRGIKQCKYLLH